MVLYLMIMSMLATKREAMMKVSAKGIEIPARGRRVPMSDEERKRSGKETKDREIAAMKATRERKAKWSRAMRG